MKVIHINENLASKGGVETYLLSVLPHLARYGVEQRVVYGEGDASIYPQSLHLPAVKAADAGQHDAVHRTLAAYFERERPDVINLHNLQNTAVIEACLAHAPTFLHAHDYRSICPQGTLYFKRTQEVCTRSCGPGCFVNTALKHCMTPRPGPGLYRYRRSQTYMRSARRFAGIIAPSESVRQRLSRSGFPAERIHVLPYFCPLTPREAPRPLPARPTVTYIGRISDNKGYAYFLEALGRLPEAVQGVMVGNMTGDVVAGLEARARAHGCLDRLTLRNWASREEIIEIMDATTVLVFPSLCPETLGIVGLEAASRGVPAVASDIGGVREWLLDGENGYLAAPKSAAELSEGLSRLVQNPEKLMAFGRRGIEIINEKFLPERHTDTLVALYEQVCGLRLQVA